MTIKEFRLANRDMLATSWIRIAKIVSLESCVICLTVMIMTLEKS